MSENITIGSDTGNTVSWVDIMGEATRSNQQRNGLEFEFRLNELVCMKTITIVETLSGLGKNPFLAGSEHGKLRGPDSVEFSLNMAEACYKWVNVRCMQKSAAESWGVPVTDTKTEAEFARQTLNSAAMMKAHGVGLVLLLVSLISDRIQERFREILMRHLTSEEGWFALTCWTKWVGIKPGEIPASKRAVAVKEAKLWSDVWITIATEFASELSGGDGPARSADISAAISRYGSLMKRRRHASMDTALLEEMEIFAILFSNGVILPWSQRKATRNYIMEAHYGSLMVSFAPSLDSADDLETWNDRFKSVRMALDKFMPEEQPRVVQVEVHRKNPIRPNRLEERRDMGMRFERKSTEQDVKIQEQPSPFQKQGCFKCGGPHMVRDCPAAQTSQQEPVRYSARLAGKIKPGSFGQRKQAGLLGCVTQDEHACDEKSDDDYESYSDDFIIHDAKVGSNEAREDDAEYATPEIDAECKKEDVEGKKTDQVNQLGLFAGHTESKVRSVTVSCDGKKLKFGLDGGLDVSLVISKHVRPGTYREEANIILEGLGGSLVIKEKALMNFSFGAASLGVVQRLPGGFDGLFGIDLIDQLDIPSVIQFRDSMNRLQQDLAGESTEDDRIIHSDGTWKPMFHYVEGPFRKDELRECVSGLRLPTLKASFDSLYPIIRERGRPIPYRLEPKVNEMIDNFVKKGVMREVDPNKWCWVTPAVFIPKVKDDGEIKLRFVMDCTTVNKRVIKPHLGSYPHHTPKFLSSIRKSAKSFAKVDIVDAFFHLPVDEATRPFLHTSVVTSRGEKIYEMCRGPQGFSETPIWWIDFIDEILRCFRGVARKKWPNREFDILAFVDDLMPYGDSLETCNLVFQSILQLLNCLGLPFGKLTHPCDRVTIIGLEFSSEGIRSAKTNLITDLSIPKNDSEVRSAIGVFQYVRHCYDPQLFIQHMSALSKLVKKNHSFTWDETTQESWTWLTTQFNNIYYHFFSVHDRLVSDECFIIQVDASSFGISSVLWFSKAKPRGVDGDGDNSPVSPVISAELSDWFDNHCKIIATKCRQYSAEEVSYPTWDQEGLAVFEGLASYSDMMMCALTNDDQVFVLSDSKAATARWRKVIKGEPLDANCQSAPRARRWARWVDDLKLFFLLNPQFMHIPGDQNSVADYFSRALTQIKPLAVGSLALAGIASHSSSTSVIQPFYSELLQRVRELTFEESNDDKYQGRLIRDIAVGEDSDTSFRMIDGLLYFCAVGSDPRLYIPKGKAILGGNMVDMRIALISLAHQSHEGRNRTSLNLKGYYWPRQNQMIKNFISSCVHCQKKNISDNLGRLVGRSTPGIFDRIVIDHGTPTQIGHNSGRSYRHVLVVCDSFSRFVQLYPVHSMEVTETVDCLLQWCLLFGFPREICTDNAIALRNRLIDRALSVMTNPEEDIRRWIAPISYPQAQGEAERVVGEIKQYLNVRDSPNWPQQLPFLAFAHNSSQYGSTGLSPHSIVMGHEPTQLVDLMRWPLDTDQSASMKDYVERLKSRLEAYHSFHALKRSEYRAISRDYYNAAHENIQFAEGDRVWLVRKLAFKTQIEGPFAIKRQRGDHMYEIDKGDSMELVPLQHLVPFIPPSEVDRDGINFASTPDDEGRLNQLIRKDPATLQPGDLILIQRGRYSNDIFEYDVASATDNFPESGLIRCDLMTIDNRDKWNRSNLIFTFPYSAIVASGFTLTKSGHLRQSTRREWSLHGIV
jgi:hypothetical protein